MGMPTLGMPNFLVPGTLLAAAGPDTAPAGASPAARFPKSDKTDRLARQAASSGSVELEGIRNAGVAADWTPADGTPADGTPADGTPQHADSLNKTAAPAAAEFPVFTYGSLRHDDVYRRAIGGQRWEDVGVPERVRGFVKGYARHPVKEAAYPAMIFTDDDRDIVDGALSYVPEAYLRLLDEFEGDDYGRFPVQVHLTTGKTVQATAWVWIAGAHWLDLSSAWSYDDFLKNKLAAWLAMSDEDFLVAGETRFQVQETVERESICDGQEDDLGFSTMDGITVMA